PAGRCARNRINSSRPNRRFTISPVCASTQYIWNTRFATSKPYVVAFISGPPFLKWLCRNSTLAHRCRSVLEGPAFWPSPPPPEEGGVHSISVESRRDLSAGVRKTSPKNDTQCPEDS